MASKRSSQRSRRDSSANRTRSVLSPASVPFLLLQARFVDRLGDDAGRAGRPGQHEVSPLRPTVTGMSPRIRSSRASEAGDGAVATARRSSGRDVDVAVGAGRLDQAELGDVARDRRLGHLEALRAEGVDDLALAADRPRRDELADGALALRA